MKVSAQHCRFWGQRMGSVFLSYDRDDADKARPIAAALEKAGHSVWWDLHVRGGAQFSNVIEEALRAADVVVVLWSANSIDSAWVRDEAAAGRDSGRLVPVTIDGTEPPLGFRQFQTIDLPRWTGRGKPSAIKQLLDDVASAQRTGGAERRTDQPASKPALERSRRSPVALAAGLVVIALAVAIVAVWRPWNSAAEAHTVLVTAGRNDPASQLLARDVAVQLGGVPSMQSAPIRLVTTPDTSPVKPDLVLEISSATERQPAGANVLLRSAADNALIWSQALERGQRTDKDVKLQMALTAARVLGCTTDTLSGGGESLSRQSRMLYLTSCGQTVEGGNYNPQPVITGLSKVVEQAPKFTAAWRKLLIAETDLIETDGQPSAAETETLRKHIAAAKLVDADMPEARLAQMSLVPATDLATRLRLVEGAYEADPHSPIVLIQLTRSLETVGRMSEAALSAFGAMNIDPTSPAVFDNYVSVLMYSGQLDLAEQQLKRAERMWHGTSTLDGLEWRFYLRFGDPKIGLKMAGDRMLGPTIMLFIEARANPAKENVDKLFAYYATRNHDRSNLPSLHILMEAYGSFHRENELYDIMLHWPDQAEFATLEDVWFRPALHEFRRDPRFMQLAARSPLLRYWRTTGKWPDFCKEPDLPYDCKKEAAKLK